MNHSDRIILQPGQTVFLSPREDGSGSDRFEILGVAGHGRSCVCYDAIRYRGGNPVAGKLKEFYPLDGAIMSALTRGEDGQLIYSGADGSLFRELCAEFLHPLHSLEKIIAENNGARVLHNYIETSEPLYGAPADRAEGPAVKGSVYIWSHELEGISFDDYLLQVRQAPGLRPEETLRTVLLSVRTMTETVQLLHSSRLLHLDIKPSNFLIPFRRERKPDPDHVTLFDIDTLSLGSEIPRYAGTEGFRAPELADGLRVSNRTDIYSLGAILFHAVVISDTIPDGLFKREYFPMIDLLVKNSDLMACSEANSGAALLIVLSNILQRCLAENPEQRYEDCGGLLKDLGKALDLLDEAVRRVRGAAAPRGTESPKAVMQKLLYERPLFEASGDQDLNVAVLGGGDYVYRFLDSCLQAGQMTEQALSVAVYCYDPEEERAQYLRFRPGLPEFVSVDGGLDGSGEEPYARLDFYPLFPLPGQPREPDRGMRFGLDREVNRTLSAGLLARIREQLGGPVDYALVALGGEETSRPAAELFAEDPEIAGPVCCLTMEETPGFEYDREKKLWPVCLNGNSAPAEIHRALEQMAFNTHITWDRSPNYDRKKKLEGFLKNKYSYNSSFLFAMSIRYKLHSVGIDFTDEQAAAEEFAERILRPMEKGDAAARKSFARLVTLEHRRWVLEMVTEGWTAPRDAAGRLTMEGCLERCSVNDMTKRTNPCIVRSTELSPLSEPPYTDSDRKKWEDPAIDPGLDELDRLSLRLHQFFRRYADELRQGDRMIERDLDRADLLLSDAPEAVLQAFYSFRFCLKNTLNGVESYARQFDQYRRNLEETLSLLDRDRQARLLEIIDRLSRDCFPAVQCYLYKNYKALDEDLIRNIPFILTYRECAGLAVPFQYGAGQGGRNEAVFPSVSAVTVLSPRRIRYVSVFDLASDRDLLVQKLQAVLNYLSRRKIRCGITLDVAWLAEAGTRGLRELEEKLQEVRNASGRPEQTANLSDFRVTFCQDEEEASGLLLSGIRESGIPLYHNAGQLFSSRLADSDFLSRIARDDRLGYFEFDWRLRRFVNCRRCGYLKYLEVREFLRIRDMFALMNATDAEYHIPEFAFDYEELWRIYTGTYIQNYDSLDDRLQKGATNWTHLSMDLKAYESQRKPLARIPLSLIGQNAPRRHFCYLPRFAVDRLEKLLRLLKEQNVVEEDSGIEVRSSDTCRLTVSTSDEIWKELSGLFDRPYLLLNYYRIRVDRIADDREPHLRITCTELDVVSAPLNVRYSYYSIQVLRNLEKSGFIRGLKTDVRYPSKNAELPGDPSEGKKEEPGELPEAENRTDGTEKKPAPARKPQPESVTVSFQYASPAIHHLLTTAGEILEVYTYFEVLKSGYFDDVASGFTFRWELGGVTNEMDLLLTKGFRSLIIEIKAVRNLQQDYYEKLGSLADLFGIGAKKLLIGNTYVRHLNGVREANYQQRLRGKQMTIGTISDSKSIQSIADKLIGIMEAMQRLPD